ncbi:MULTISPECIES: DNA methyltransferase [Staphylococcus]|nr:MULTISPECIES: DNA methyltransferase [Staphylococcus]MCE4949900.1 hypothetical protein [Staphylococcus hominis]MCE4953202.1 hypothetical protein [Staphylococcus hominis]MDU0440079.1 DNA methyltransferase [Staphylococcus haemolyticus]PTK35438.1 hypothetical protein BUZ45_10970 [Staphylococcus hominis]
MSNIYSYHAKFHESIPYEYIKKYSNINDTIFDPFCGSGTTLKEALKLNRNSIGIDISPIAILSSRVNTNLYNKKKLENLMKELIFEYENIKKIKYTTFPNYDKWYTRENYINLNKLKNSIDKIEEDAYRDFFLLCFLSIAKKVSNKRKTWNIGYIADNVLPNMESKLKALDCFKQKVQKEIIKMGNYEDNSERVETSIIKKDISKYRLNKTIDMVMTSPPYPFAVDFIRYHRLSMYWLQEDIEKLTSLEIGARNKRNKKNNLQLFFNEIETSFINIMSSVKSDGYWVMTIADTKRNKTKIPFVDWTINLFFENGWILVDDKLRELKNQSMAQKRISSEHILVFKKI